MSRRIGTTPRSNQMSLRFLWGAADSQPERIRDEPVRTHSEEALAEVAAQPVQSAPGPGQLLLELGRGDRGARGGPEHSPRGGRPAERGLSGEAGTPEHGETERGITS